MSAVVATVAVAMSRSDSEGGPVAVRWQQLLSAVAHQSGGSDSSDGGSGGELEFEGFAAVFRQQMQLAASEFSNSDVQKLWNAALLAGDCSPAARSAPASLVADYMDSLALPLWSNPCPATGSPHRQAVAGCVTARCLTG